MVRGPAGGEETAGRPHGQGMVRSCAPLWHASRTSVETVAEVLRWTLRTHAWNTAAVRASDVFELLRDGRPRTRAELADASGLARSTIASRIDVLMRMGLV
ncbi:MAG: hypothetical protein JWM84_592, partial [Nocardioides sp.]|nr:hypothetical protein [Nocardioides sp.]